MWRTYTPDKKIIYRITGLKKEIIITRDGSETLYLPEFNETYHSKFGAIHEAYHVFIENGLGLFKNQPVSILEMGFGTGLNTFITYIESNRESQNIHYTSIDAYPLDFEEAVKMNYGQLLEDGKEYAAFNKIHSCGWEIENKLSDTFILVKKLQFFDTINIEAAFDIIYFDAFSYRVQPELWSLEMFRKMYRALKQNGVLVTYACRNVIKKAMLEAGFSIEVLPGSLGRREMLRAVKS